MQHRDETHGHLVVAAEDRAGPLGQREQLQGRPPAALRGEIAGEETFASRGDAGGRHRPAIAGQALAREDVVRRAAEVGDAPIPEIEQVAHRQFGGSHVVDADMRDEQGLETDRHSGEDHRVADRAPPLWVLDQVEVVVEPDELPVGEVGEVGHRSGIAPASATR
jgi:hypothetical protein